jgi:glycosyltransferase involved in cell wall biosynthesis
MDCHGLKRELAVVDDLNVFVHLGSGFGANRWRKRYEGDLIPGVNEPLPYGYYRAEGDGVRIVYSEDREESRLVEFLRKLLCRVVGFDLIHAWRNRLGLLNADIIWTHTEREHLAVILLLMVSRPTKKPQIIAQCIWLFDQWPGFSRVRRRLCTWLLSRADLVTTHSPDNLQIARSLLANTRTDLVLFGINADSMRPPHNTPCHQPIRIAALGNDMHRDWETLLRAFAGKPFFELRIASPKLACHTAGTQANVVVKAAVNRKDVEELYAWADLIAVPLKANLHGSGISVILEATLAGRPVISTDTGGLRAYFSDHEVCYVPIGDAIAMQRSAIALAQQNRQRVEQVRLAQRRVLEAGLTSEAYAMRHRDLSFDLLRNKMATAPFTRAPRGNPIQDRSGDQTQLS